MESVLLVKCFTFAKMYTGFTLLCLTKPNHTGCRSDHAHLIDFGKNKPGL